MATKQETAPTLMRYVVVADAVTLTVAKKKDGTPVVERLNRGRTISAPPDHESIVELLAMKGIVPATEENLAKVAGGRRLTVRGAARAMGAEDDPVAPVVEDVQPLPAPLPDSNVVV